MTELDKTQQAEIDKDMASFFEDCKIERAKERKIKNDFKKQLKGLINVSGLFKDLEFNDNWYPIGIFSAVDFKCEDNRFPEREYISITDGNHEEEKHLYYRKISGSEIRGIDHYYCHQWTTGMEGDSYSGYLLYPLKNGKYFKVSYSC